MDFDSLPRRGLQALCKKNKIPANVTNAAMAESLKSLAIVEGIDELLQTCNSEMAQLSIEPRVRMEAASPFLPPTGGRSTRRRNPPKEETSWRSTRNANESQAVAFETPVAPQTNRKKDQTASACRKMDSLFKECAAEEKKDVVLTPAPWGVTNQRRAAKEGSAVKENEGLRRSARLKEKSAKLLKKGNGNENPDFSDKDVSASTNSDECSAKKDEEHVVSAEEQDISTDVETTVDASTVREENREKKIQAEVVPFKKQVVSTAKEDEEQVDSAEKQEISSDVETTLDAVTIKEDNHEKIIQAEVVPSEKQVVSTAKNDEQVHLTEEQDIVTGVETVVDAVTVVAANPGKIIQSEVVQCEKQVVSTAEEVEQVPSSEGESDYETDDASVELKVVANIEQVAFDPKIAAEFDDQSYAEASKDENFVMALDLNNEAQETDGIDVIETSMTKIGGAPECEVADIECEDDFAFSESDDDAPNVKDSDPEEVTPFGVKEELELNTYMHNNPDDSVISEPMEPSDLSMTSDKDDTVKILVKDDVLESPVTVLEDIAADETADQVFLGAFTDAPLSEEAPTQQLAGVENDSMDSSLVVPPVSTQARASASKESIKKRVTAAAAAAAASDNKENINKGSKTRRSKRRSKIVKKEIAETAQNDEQTMLQLANEVDKLEITQKLVKSEVPPARPALQLLQKNQ